MLKNIRVRTKFFVLLVIPVTALIVLSAVIAFGKYREMRAMASAIDIVALSSANGALIHELQKERGLSASFIASKGAFFAAEVKEQRRASAALRQSLQEKMRIFSANNPSAPLNASFAPLLERLDRLNDLRAQVDKFSISAPQAIAEYSQTIGQLQGLIKGVLEYFQDAAIYGQATRFLNFVSAKEFAGQERATLNTALSAGSFDKELYRAWLERIAIQNALLSASLEGSAPAIKALYAQQVEPLQKTVEQFRNRAFRNADQPKLEDDPKAWFAASTAYINALHKVESAMSEQLESLAHSQARAARLNFFATMLLAAAAVLCSLLLAWRIVRNITSPLDRSVEFAQRVAGGQLDSGLDMVRLDEFGTLSKALNSMLDSIKEMIEKSDAATNSARQEAEKAREATQEAMKARQLAEQAKRDGMVAAAERISKVVTVLSSVSQDISAQLSLSDKGAHAQSKRLAAAASAMEEMNAMVLEVAKNSSHASGIADTAKEQAGQGSERVADVGRHIAKVLTGTQQLKEAMGRLGVRVQDVDKVLTVISDIADQTNLLALNAAIEAARAGEAGRGFAVVADEVRKLAEKTMTATKEVAAVLSGIQQDTERNINTVDDTVAGMLTTTNLAKDSGEALKAIVQLFEQTRDQINSIAASSAKQSAVSEEINRNVDDVNRIALETVNAVEQSTRGMSSLLGQTKALERLIDELRAV